MCSCILGPSHSPGIPSPAAVTAGDTIGSWQFLLMPLYLLIRGLQASRG